MSTLPDRPGDPSLPRQLTSEQFEMVIRRAAELQARAAEDIAGAEMTEEEVLRIGRELGLSRMHLGQALAEVRSGAPSEETGALVSLLGEATLRASRTVAGDPDTVRRLLEEYLVQCEYMAVLRRFPDRTLYERGSGVVAAVGRATSQAFGRTPPLRLRNLEVAVQPLEAGYAHVTLSTSLRGERAEYATGTVLGGLGGGGAVATVLGIAVAPPAALLGLPVLGLVVYGTRTAYSSLSRRAQLALDSLLDRLQHGELQARVARRGPRFG